MNEGLLFRGVVVEGRRCDVRTAESRIVDVGIDLPIASSRVVDGAGGELLPGLHDHHIHLLALAASRSSVDCSTYAGLAGLAELEGTGWIRGTSYHESVAGVLDRYVLDSFVPDRPVRVQHRSGALWMLNSVALDLVWSALTDNPDVERDGAGVPTGRFWRFDKQLRDAVGAEPPSLEPIVADLHRVGITGVTDATPELEPAAVDLVARTVAPKLRTTLLGSSGAVPGAVGEGPWKLLLRDHDLPDYAALREAVANQHAAGRAVAIHCVTRESLLLTLAVLADVGPLRGDRIEHAAVVPPGTAEQIAELGVAVVTQPSLLRLRGDDYAADMDQDDVGCLYPYASLKLAGVAVAPSSDAPYGDVDPWQSIRDAVKRRTTAGLLLGEGERSDPADVLAGYLSPAGDPGGPPRRLEVGAAADLCLLHVPLSVALKAPDARQVRGVVVDGEPQTGILDS